MILFNKNILFAISIIIFLIFIFVFWAYSIDDAFVTFRYAENLVNGHGLVFNPGDKPVEGYSNFLWLLILSLLYAIGLSTYLSAKILGIAFFLVSAIIWFRYLKNNQEGSLWAAPILFLISPITAFWAVSGLELGLHSLLVSGAIISLLKKSSWSSVFLTLIVLNRPEGFIIAFSAILLIWILDRRLGQVDGKYISLNLAVVIIFSILLLTFRMSEFGYPLPNTYYMKSRITLDAFVELGRQLLYFLPLTILFIVRGLKLFADNLSEFGVAAEAIAVGKSGAEYNQSGDGEMFSRTALCAGLFILQAAVSVNALSVMNFHFRYLIAFLPLFLIVALEGLSLLSIRRHRIIAGSLIILSVLSPGISVWGTVQREKEIIAAQENFMEWAEPLPENIRFSITDTGRIPYYTRKHFYDIWGLTSSEIAHKGFNPLVEYLRFPDYFVLVGYLNKNQVVLKFGTEQLIYRNRGFKYAYPLIGAARPPGEKSYLPGYYYLIFRKDQRAVDSLLSTPVTE